MLALAMDIAFIGMFWSNLDVFNYVYMAANCDPFLYFKPLLRDFNVKNFAAAQFVFSLRYPRTFEDRHGYTENWS
jgi:hypothetical protein